MSTTLRVLILVLVVLSEVVALLFLLRSRRAKPSIILAFGVSAVLAISITAWVLFALPG